MKNEPIKIFEEYRNAINFKSSLGNKGLYEQNRINERFYIGDQWYGAKCGNERPLVRHNIIKRIGEYKMSQILSNPLSVNFSAEGVPNTINFSADSLKDRLKQETSNFSTSDETNLIMATLSNYYGVTAERVGLSSLSETALRNAFITGTGIIYTYWDGEIQTGLYADSEHKVSVNGDINCEVLDIENVFFGDPYISNIQKQPFVIISALRDTESVLREAVKFGADNYTVNLVKEKSNDGKITVLTKLFKEYNHKGEYTIKCVKVIENATLRREFDTGLKLYPLSVFQWEKQNGLIYGQSEITYLIPNQIAINRMITANVWATMAAGMPMMVINGDTVPDGITNEPGQIIKVFGSNEDVNGAVKFVSPPDFSKNFDSSVSALIENTLTQSGANEVALGDSRADNATALITMREAAVMPLQIIKNRFYSFIEDISRIWADFWVAYYGQRKIKLSDKNGSWYMPFNSQKLAGLIINAKVEVGNGTVYSERETVNTLLTLFDKGIINREQFLKRLPEGIIADKNSLITLQEGEVK